MSSRFQPFANSSLRTSSLRRLKTAFSPSSSASSNHSFKWGSGQSTPHRSASTASIATSSPLSSHMGSPNMNAECCETMEGLVPVNTAYSIDAVSEQPRRRPSAQKQQQQQQPHSSRSRLRSILMRRRRQQSSWDLTVEEEQKTFGPALRVFEPRQQGQISMGSIFEVMEGRC